LRRKACDLLGEIGAHVHHQIDELVRSPLLKPSVEDFSREVRGMRPAILVAPEALGREGGLLSACGVWRDALRCWSGVVEVVIVLGRRSLYRGGHVRAGRYRRR